MLICSSLPWRVVDFDPPRLTKLFLERCEFNPHAIFARNYLWSPSVEAERLVLWGELEGRMFNNLRFLIFVGSRHEFDCQVVDLLRRAPNLSSLEVNVNSHSDWVLECSLNDYLPHLTMLRINKVRISWTSPLPRNLTNLILDFTGVHTPHEFTPIQTFLVALENCPDLEDLKLISAGPEMPDGDQDNCEVVVRLGRLKGLTLRFEDPKMVGYILSHIWFPEPAKIQVSSSCCDGLCAALPQVLPPPRMETFQYLRKTKTITINLDTESYNLTTDNFHIVLRPPDDEDMTHQSNLETSPQFASKVIEITGSDTVTALHVLSDLPFDIPQEMWEKLLHGFPRLEVISYSPFFIGPRRDYVDPFCLTFSEPFEGKPVCPQLWDLRIPWAFAHGPSAVTLKRALLERDAYGKRLKRISLSHRFGENGILALEPLRDVVDEVSGFRDLSTCTPPPVSRFSGQVIAVRSRRTDFFFPPHDSTATYSSGVLSSPIKSPKYDASSDARQYNLQRKSI